MSCTELFGVLYFYMICTTIWMEVHTWSSNYLRAKGAFSDHGMQWMRGVCYAAFDVMTGLPYMDNCFPSLSFTHTGILHTSYYRDTDSQTHTKTHVYVWKDTCAKEKKLMRTKFWRWALLYKDIECKLPRDSFRILKYAIMLGARMCSLNTHCTRMHLAQGSLSTLSSPMLSFHSWWLTYAEFVPQSWKSRRWYWTHNIIPLINLKSWRWYRAHLPISPPKPFWSHPRCWGCQIDHDGEWLSWAEVSQYIYLNLRVSHLFT